VIEQLLVALAMLALVCASASTRHGQRSAPHS